MEEKIRVCIEIHAKQAFAVSFVPLVSVPIVYGICAKMIVSLDKILGIRTAWVKDSEIVQDIIAGIFAAPALAIPVLGGSVAAAFITSIGENYAQAVAAVKSAATKTELADHAFVARRVKEELQKIRNSNRELRRKNSK